MTLSTLGWILFFLALSCLATLAEVLRRRRERRDSWRLQWGPEQTSAGSPWGALARGLSLDGGGAAVAAPPLARPRRIAARVDWTCRMKTRDGKVLWEDRFRNLIVNDGLDGAKDRLFNPATTKEVFDFIAIGSGATAETVDDTELESELARVEADYTAGGVGVATLRATFDAGVGTGTITEVGLFNDDTAGDMFSRHTGISYVKGADNVFEAVAVITLTAA